MVATSKYKYEGFREQSIYFFLAAIVVDHLPIYLRFVLLTLVSSTYCYYPVLCYPKPSGPHLVGYRDFEYQNRQISIFYPTNIKTSDDLFMPKNVQYWKFWAESKKFKGVKANEAWLQFQLSYLNHMTLDIQKAAPVITLKGEKFRVIIFSHGLASHRNAYSFFFREWASNGYLVFSVNHNDIICPENRIFEDFNTRNNDLKRRYEDCSIVLDLIYSKKTDWKEILGVGNLHNEINYEKISMVGHSYGGATGCYLAMKDKRITGPCVFMDPWMFPIAKTDYSEIQNPVLVIRALDFESFSPGNKPLVYDFMRKQKAVDQRTITCYLDKSTHATFTDFSLYFGRLVEKTRQISSFKDIPKYYHEHNALINSFFMISSDCDRLDKGFETKFSIQFEKSRRYPTVGLTIEHI